MSRFDAAWPPARRAQLLALVNERAAEQIEGDAELREVVDWLIGAVGMTPSRETYRLVFLAAAVVAQQVG